MKDVPGTINKPVGMPFAGRDTVMHPFTGISITDKGIAYLSDYIAAIREVIGMEVPLSSDHYGHNDVNSCIRRPPRTDWDTGFNMRASDDIKPGDVLVVELGGAVDRATFMGDVTGLAIKTAGAAGVVIDGGLRDLPSSCP